MLILRKAQIDAIGAASEESLRLRMRRHVESEYPEICAALGDKRVALRVKLGLQRARKHGIRDESHLELFLELMFEFGREFDRSPEVPWGKAVFAAPYPIEQKMIALAQRATAARVERITGRVE
ncbi:MAG: hypothetical protein U0414_28565 [Polyangiaceae bacterium]